MAIRFSVTEEYKPIDEKLVDKLLAEEIAKNNRKIVVLDDDPTGVQTVHDIHVYTGWDEESIRKGFLEENNLFYILTNSRGFTEEETTKAHNEIAAVVDKSRRRPGKSISSSAGATAHSAGISRWRPGFFAKTMRRIPAKPSTARFSAPSLRKADATPSTTYIM